MDSIVGITFEKWYQLLRENSFKTSPKYWGKEVTITAKSVFNSKVSRLEREEWGTQIDNAELNNDPIFILGHWRSGTTMLQNYLTVDPQFATPRLADVLYPNSLVRYHSRHNGLLEQRKEGNARPMDNIQVHLASPAEDEFALAVLTLTSPLFSWVFPQNSAYYDQFLTFKSVDPLIIEQWRHLFKYYLQKLTLTYKKQLLLKSPQHTARIHLLLKLFPQAKFIHIHRHPYNLFKSTLKLYNTAVQTSTLQRIPKSTTSFERISAIYNEMYDSFFDHKDTIPDANFVDIRFEELEQQPVETIQRIYESIELDGFDTFKPLLQQEVEKTSNYQKNKYADLTDTEKDQLYDEWRRSFEYWDYKR